LRAKLCFDYFQAARIKPKNGCTRNTTAAVFRNSRVSETLSLWGRRLLEPRKEGVVGVERRRRSLFGGPIGDGSLTNGGAAPPFQFGPEPCYLCAWMTGSDVTRGSLMNQNDAGFTGSIPQLHDVNVGPTLMIPYARDLAARLTGLQ